MIGCINPNTGEYVSGSCEFIEASWVPQPAFEGAVLNYVIETEEMREAREKNVTANNDLTTLTSEMFLNLKIAGVDNTTLRVAQGYVKDKLIDDKIKRISNKLIW